MKTVDAPKDRTPAAFSSCSNPDHLGEGPLTPSNLLGVKYSEEMENNLPSNTQVGGVTRVQTPLVAFLILFAVTSPLREPREEDRLILAHGLRGSVSWLFALVRNIRVVGA